jgi:hypothetical protein
VRPSLLEHTQAAIESAGISCLSASLTSCVVFAVGGATSSVLAVQSLCWLCALIVMLEFVLQVAAPQPSHRVARDATVHDCPSPCYRVCIPVALTGTGGHLWRSHCARPRAALRRRGNRL